MAQRTILVDTCVYLRLARHVHPLLNEPFGDGAHVLQIIPEFDREYAGQARLKALHPWVEEEPFVENRKAPFTLPPAMRAKKQGALAVVDSCAFEQDLALSKVDVSALATSLLMEYPLATDDTDMRDVALIIGVDTLGSVELLRCFVDENRLTLSDAADVLKYLRGLPDLPKAFLYDCGRLFWEIDIG